MGRAAGGPRAFVDDALDAPPILGLEGGEARVRGDGLGREVDGAVAFAGAKADLAQA